MGSFPVSFVFSATFIDGSFGGLGIEDDDCFTFPGLDFGPALLFLALCQLSASSFSRIWFFGQFL